MRISKLSQSLSLFPMEEPKDVTIKKPLYSSYTVKNSESSKNNVLEMFRARTIKTPIRRS